MLKELPNEFKNIIKKYYYQKGFIGFQDGLYYNIDNNKVYGVGIAFLIH